MACVEEERFSRIKNHVGFPSMAVDFVLKFAGIRPADLDLVTLGCRSLATRNFWSKDDIKKCYTTSAGKEYSRLHHWIARGLWHSGALAKTAFRLYNGWYWRFIYPAIKRRQVREISESLDNYAREKIRSVDHHLAHAYAAMYGVARGKGDGFLVMTHDGFGDDTCGTISVVNSPRDWNLISSTPNFSTVAGVYECVTMLLGMKRIEHEYKVMGLAPYADKVGAQTVYDQVFADFAKVDEDLRIVTKIPLDFYDFFREVLVLKHVKERVLGYRFDCIAGAVQRLTEEVLVDWVKRAIERTTIPRLVLGGGVFMNVKANMEIMYRAPVEQLYICPSCGDESTAIGAAYWGYKLWCEQNSRSFDPKPLTNLYLGPSYTKEEILGAIERHNVHERYRVDVVEGIEQHIAGLLAKGKIVARLSGRMEFGARALGNRSILADPSNPDIVKELNEQIKQRDFWMPFAPTILKERQHEYIVNPKGVEAPYMVLGFRTTPLAWKELRAALHPYDQTCRPQVLDRDWNVSYYRLIKEFENITGIGGVLNTSFNLHGEPIVCSPNDAIYTLENSGLRYLAMENYLVSK